MPRVAKAIFLMICPMLVATDVAARNVADQLEAIERERIRSLVDADMPAARLYHADDFELITPNGRALSKEQYLGQVADGSLDYLVWEPEEIRVRLFRNSAVLRYRAHVRISDKVSQRRDLHFWYTGLYEKRLGQWQVVWAHATVVKE
jgi:hypothetical protein